MPRRLGVQHRDDAAAWPQHAANLADEARGIGRVVQHAVAVDEIEARIGKWKRLCIVVDEAAGQTAQPEVFLGEAQMAAGQVDVRDPRAVSCELREVGADSAADFEDVLARMPIEFHHRRHPRRITPIAVRFDFVEPVQRARHAPIGVVRADGVLVPLRLGRVLVVVAGLNPSYSGSCGNRRRRIVGARATRQTRSDARERRQHRGRAPKPPVASKSVAIDGLDGMLARPVHPRVPPRADRCLERDQLRLVEDAAVSFHDQIAITHTFVDAGCLD